MKAEILVNIFLPPFLIKSSRLRKMISSTIDHVQHVSPHLQMISSLALRHLGVKDRGQVVVLQVFLHDHPEDSVE